jgi:hypothetical protein
LKGKGMECFVDRHILSYNQKHTDDNINEYRKILNEESVQASPLLPMLVKANNLIAYWIIRFPQQSITELFDAVLDAKSETKWLWEKRRFDLLSTERYMEAIADYFDYYDAYERNYASKALESEKIRQKAEKKAQEDAKKEIEEQRIIIEKEAKENALREIEQTIRAEYGIENQINTRIEQKIEEATARILTKTLNNIIKYNSATKAKQRDMSLSENDLLIKETFEKYIVSYFANDLLNAANNINEMSPVILEKNSIDGLKKFMYQYFEFTARNYTSDIGEFGDIFNMIEKYKKDN